MLINQSKTKTGWKFTFVCVTETNNVCSMNILCTRRPDYENAKQSAIEHIQKTFLSFRRFATNKEAEYLGNVFLKSLDNLYQPTGKYYIDFLTNNNTVNDNQAGRNFITTCQKVYISQ